MRRPLFILLVGLGIGAGLSQPASAADLSTRPVVKAPVMQPAAPPQVSGYLELYTGWAGSEDDARSSFFPRDLRFDGWPIGGAGRGNWWATSNLSLQLDVQGEGTQYKVPSDELAPGFSGRFSTLAYLIGGHANWRDPQIGLLGIFGGIGDAGGNSSTLGADNSGVRHALIGAEGQYYWGPLVTLYAQGGYDATMDMGNLARFADVNAWFARGTARVFVMPNLLIEGTGQYESGTISFNSFSPSFPIPDSTFNTWLWRAKAEWKPGTLPFSLFAMYEGSRTDFGNAPVFGTTSERVTDNRVLAGLRLWMGQDTLLGNDRGGATLDIIDPLGAPTSPLMIRPVGQDFVPVSDMRLKRDIVLIARRDDGLGIYSYRYLWSDTVYVGVMAQEVALIHPDAVVHGADGYLRVNYNRLGTTLLTLPQWEAVRRGEKI